MDMDARGNVMRFTNSNGLGDVINNLKSENKKLKSWNLKQDDHCDRMQEEIAKLNEDIEQYRDTIKMLAMLL